MAKLVNKTYGDALFDLAVSEGKTDTLFQEAVELREIFRLLQIYLVAGHPRKY